MERVDSITTTVAPASLVLEERDLYRRALERIGEIGSQPRDSMRNRELQYKARGQAMLEVVNEALDDGDALRNGLTRR